MMGSQLSVRSGACSEIGPVRPTNDDCVFADPHCRFYVVLDGIGGHAGGGQASKILLDSLRDGVESMCSVVAEHPDKDQLEAAVSAALNKATDRMLEIAAKKAEYANMGTVFALAFIANNKVFYTHVGDCRIYLQRDGEIRQLTSDETFVQLMVDAGVIKAEDAKEHPMRNIVLNGVGAHPRDHEPVVRFEPIRPGDKLLLTTDGVSDAMELAEMAAILSVHEDPELAAQGLVGVALQNGSRDNASCVVAVINEGSQMHSNEDLHEELAKLHDILAKTEEIDDETYQELVHLSGEIKSLIEISKVDPETGPLRKKLDDFVLSFETHHPAITAIVARIANALARLGI